MSEVVTVFGASFCGQQPVLVRVDVSMAPPGKPSGIVGVRPGASERELRGTVNNALRMLGEPIGSQPGAVLVELTDATKALDFDVTPPEPPGLALAIAVGVWRARLLAAAGPTVGALSGTPTRREKVDATTVFVGDLGLSGQIRPVRGGLLLAQAAHLAGFTTFIAAEGTAVRAAGAGEQDDAEWRVLQAAELLDVIEWCRGARGLTTLGAAAYWHPAMREERADVTVLWPDGYERVKMALVLSLLSGVPLLLVGPDNAHMTQWARRLTRILPGLTRAQQLEVDAVHDRCRLPILPAGRPFRAPHHTVSRANLLTELQLAHLGVLMLDDVVYSRRLDVVEVANAAFVGRMRDESVPSPHLPCAAFIVGTVQTCPCGQTDNGVPYGAFPCRCSPTQRADHHWRVRMQCEGVFGLAVRVVPDPAGGWGHQAFSHPFDRLDLTRLVLARAYNQQSFCALTRRSAPTLAMRVANAELAWEAACLDQPMAPELPSIERVNGAQRRWSLSAAGILSAFKREETEDAGPDSAV